MVNQFNTLPCPSRYNEIYDSTKKFRNLDPKLIFTFGSNLAGRHGKGAAQTALFHYGAKYGVGIGLVRRSYAIPTKDENLNVLKIEVIKKYVDDFVKESQKEEQYFFVTAIGCGLAGYPPNEIAPLFHGVRNCWLPDCFLPYVL